MNRRVHAATGPPFTITHHDDGTISLYRRSAHNGTVMMQAADAVAISNALIDLIEEQDKS